ncbi:MAG: tryptophan--tRNA ligase [Oscillospiraceae bacterium]|jgi:tryptophanyl-tRNA synthetase|nr:tryptophan--tRNA ligase [Oscillospiraceae bacterium]
MESPKTDKKKIAFSGIQATGSVHIGNYLGAIKNWVDMQEAHRCIYSIVDMHAITVRQDPKALRENTLRAYALGIACGIDPEKSIFFIQSHVHTHAELTWVLNCFTPYGELGRMTQFKDKSQTNADNINAGLFDYPVLMASDILLYQAALVPVGADQKQHIELTRNTAIRFNSVYGNVFEIPEPLIPETGARVMSLQDPTKKMSKSDDNPKSCVALLDSRDAIIKKFRSAVTDSEAEVVMREGKDGINNLITIYGLMTGRSVAETEAEFGGRGYGDFKTAVGEAVADKLRPIQEKFDDLMKDKGYVESCYRKNADRALQFSGRTLEKVYKKVGFLAR